MKIVLVHKFYFYHRGAERYFFDLKKILEDHGHDVIPFALKHPKNEPTPYSRYFIPWVEFSNPRGMFDYVRILERIFYSFVAKRAFSRLIRDVRPDIVHIQNIYHHISPSILDVCRAYDIPVIQTIHDYKLVCPNYKLFCNGHVEDYCLSGAYWKEITNRCVGHSLLRSALVVLETFFHRFFRLYDRSVIRFIAPSHYVARAIRHAGIPQRKIVVLPHSLNSSNIRPRYAIGPYLVYCGSLSEEKGVDTLICAMRDVSLSLKIIGDGPHRAFLEKKVFDLNLQEKITFLGAQNQSTLFAVLRNSALVVVPSLWHEVFGYVILEAWAAGKAVIGSSRGAIIELLGNIDQPFLFRPGDPEDLSRVIREALKNPKRLEKMGQQGREIIEKDYHPAAYYEKLMGVYTSSILSEHIW